MSASGLFISLDGLDGTGKSTQCRLLAEWLRQQGHQVTECVDPGGTEIGGSIREILLDNRRKLNVACEMFLFMASRAQLVEEIIRPALDAAHIVVCDRFLLANVVYQGHAGGLKVEEIWSTGRIATGGLTPDLTIVFDLPVKVAVKRRRGEADRMESRAREYQQRVRDGFLAEAKRNPDKICVIDASPPLQQVQQAVLEKIEPLLR